MTRTNNSDPPRDFSVGLVLGRADAARDQYLARHFNHTHNLSVQTFPDDESVVSVLAKLETGDDKERADKAAARLGACGLSSVPSWLRPHKALSNGEAARVDVARERADGEPRDGDGVVGAGMLLRVRLGGDYGLVGRVLGEKVEPVLCFWCFLGSCGG